ncbi:nicotinate-nucleotide--dimethylbenzimidazole phosphoribosyltransferase [Streptomyces calvus]|uniref:nicotinate-nucleotide--dimethylbenzimidazole phosphoribosyltransferase n=1 Tax=Streptomyces calvus TaxID=67282 RepID=UPI003645A7B5
MTDTGQVPGEGLPENAGMVEQPGVPAPGTYTYLSDSPASPAEDEDLLLPGAQGAWGNEVAPPAPEPVVETVHEPGPHEMAGRDSGSVDLTGVRLPEPPQSAPRRPLHLGPPIPNVSASPVRSLADRGPADLPARQPGPPTLGPEYLDVPRAREAAAPQQTAPQQTAPQAAAPQAAAPWGAQATVGAGATAAETVVPSPEPVDAAQAVVARVATEAVTAAEAPQDGTEAPAVPSETAAVPAAEAAAVPQQAAVGRAPVVEPAVQEGAQVAEAPQGAATPASVHGEAAEAPEGAATPAAGAVPSEEAAEEAAEAAEAVTPEQEPGVAPTVEEQTPTPEVPGAEGAAEPEGAQVPTAEAAEAVETAGPEGVAAEQPQGVQEPDTGAVEAAEPGDVPAAELQDTQAPEARTAEVVETPESVETAEPVGTGEADEPGGVPVPAAEAAAPAQPEAAQAPEPVQAPDTEAPAPVPAQDAELLADAQAPGAEAPTQDASAPGPEAPAPVPAQEPQPAQPAPAPDAAPTDPSTAVSPAEPAQEPVAEPAQEPVAETDAPEAPQDTEAVQGTEAPMAEEAPAQPVPAEATEPALADQASAAADGEAPADEAPAPADEAPARTGGEALAADGAQTPVPAAAPTGEAAPAPLGGDAPAADGAEALAADGSAAPAPTGEDAPAPLGGDASAPASAPSGDVSPEQVPAEALVTQNASIQEAEHASDGGIDAMTELVPSPDEGVPHASTAAPAAEPRTAPPAPADAAAVQGPQQTPAAPLPGTVPQEPGADGALGQFVPVDGTVPTTPHLAPTPPQGVTVPAARDAEPAQNPDDLDTRGAGVETDAEPEAPRHAGPAAPPYDEAERAAVLKVMRERRDIRNGFRSDPIPHEVLLRVLEAAHTAPSVGHSQPWDFVVIRSAETRRSMHELAMRQRDAYAKSLPKGRAKQFKELKIEAILDTPVNIVVTADPTRGGRHTLGRHTQPQMAPYSAALAVENLWLAARAEGLGVGWVSFFDEREMVRVLGLPEHLEVIAYLCVGYVDEFPDEPELMQAGWSKRRPLSWVVHEETYGRRALPGEEPHDLLAETVAQIRPLDAKALGEAWERQKRMTKPAGALGMLEIISAQLSGLSRQCPPPIPEPAAVAIFAGDHGVHAQGVTPWPQEVTAQMVANFLGGGAVCNAFAAQVGAEVCVVDVGVSSDLPATPGLLPRKIRAGTSDMTTGPAMSREEAKKAIEVGIETARDLVAAGNKVLLTGEMGIANTTASAALISVFTGADPAEVTGRGTGINDETLARKTEVVRRALEVHQPDPADPVGVLAAVGGFEHAAMVGLLLGGASLRTPVILDGVSAGAAALVARAIAPEVLAACIAGHRSAEPGHVAALNKLGLRPLVDLDLRLGEGTGALLALPLVQSTARAMHEVATFDSAGVTEK